MLYCLMGNLNTSKLSGLNGGSLKTKKALMKEQLGAAFLSFAMRMLPEVSPAWAKQHINCSAKVAVWINEHRHYVI